MGKGLALIVLSSGILFVGCAGIESLPSLVRGLGNSNKQTDEYRQSGIGGESKNGNYSIRNDKYHRNLEP